MKPTKSGNTMEILRQMHKDAPVYVPFMLILKKDFTTNFSFYFFSYLFRFIGIFVLSGKSDVINSKVFSERFLNKDNFFNFPILFNKFNGFSWFKSIFITFAKANMGASSEIQSGCAIKSSSKVWL